MHKRYSEYMDTNKAQILLVEDDVSTLKLYKELLTSEGYQITTASDGELGLTQATKGGYDLILLDVMLPKMDGLAVLAKLKKSPPKTKNGPIVILSNLSHHPVIKEAMSLGAKDHLIKSDISPDKLLLKIKSYLK